MTKLQALDALASSSSAAPGERENAARAASALRAKTAAVDGERPVSADLLDEMFGARPAHPARPAVRKETAPRDRCAAAFPSGSRCPRRPKLRGFCLKCFRRDAPVWVAKPKRRSGKATERNK